MVRSRIVSALSLVLAIAAMSAPTLGVAEEIAPAEANAYPVTTPQWSLGAGLVSPSWGYMSYGIGLTSLASVGGDPSYMLSAERRLGESAWLLFRGSFSYRKYDAPTYSSVGTSGTVEQNQLTTEAAMGVRYLLVSDVVDLSIYGMVGGAYGRVTGSTSAGSGPSLSSFSYGGPGSRSYAVGATFGLALERSLTERLSLRLATDLADLQWGHARTKSQDYQGNTATSKTRDLRAGVQLRPSLELRLYF